MVSATKRRFRGKNPTVILALEPSSNQAWLSPHAARLQARLTSGYYGLPAETRAANRNLWFHTGDVGHFDGDGYLYVHGRRTDEVTRGRQTTNLLTIDHVVASHPDVSEAAALRVEPDEIKVCVVSRSGAAVDAETVGRHCDERLGLELVRYVEIVQVLPRTPTGKVERFRLEDCWRTSGTRDRLTVT